MNPTRYRVVQWATGHSGQRALREVIRHPALDLVGVLVYDPKKNAVDAGELCGEPRTGVAATTDRAAVLQLKADCALYMPRASGEGPTRAGLTIAQVLDDVVALLESGTNVVTICTDFFARGHRRLGDDGRARILAACERGKSSIFATGGSPGFIQDTLSLALLSVQRRVESVEIEEFGDVSRRPSPYMILEQMKFGKPLATFDPSRRASHLLGEYGPVFGLIADAAGLTVDEWAATGEVAAARRDTKIVAGKIAAGTVAAQRMIIHGRSRGVDVVRFVQYAYVTTNVEPAWDLRPMGWRVQVRGDAPFDVQVAMPVPLEEIASFVPAYNANRPVNAIPYVCAAPPGFLLTTDLPPILPVGPSA
jgi:4-hydroxy-tetrahydrodipicolinate reductase